MAQGYVIGADTRARAENYTGFLRQNATVTHRESAEVEHRNLGGGEEAAVAEAAPLTSYIGKIVSVAGAGYNVTLHETVDGASVGTGILQIAEKQVSEALTVGRMVSAMPHVLIITSVVAAGDI
jgi:hypothetical protein